MNRLKYLLCIFLSCSFLANSAQAQCPTNYAATLYAQLKEKLPWVDINQENQSCHFTIRYYPCEQYTTLTQLLPEIIAHTFPHCIFQIGQHEKIEGYCALKSNAIACTAI